MASGGGSSSGFDFGADDVLCSYDDNGNQTDHHHHRHQTNPSNYSSSSATAAAVKEFRESRMGRSAFVPIYTQSEEFPHQELISTVEKTMKKYADNLLRFLEGISSRLSQLELYCYNLEKSVGEMRSDLLRENRETDSKLSSLEKHLQEVHRSIQILRDKQELADTQKELAKLQFVHKESSGGCSQHKEEAVTPSASDLKKLDNPPEVQKQQLALALPHQVSPPTSVPSRFMEQHPPMGPSQISSQNVHGQTQPTYYPQQNQMPTPPLQTQHPKDRYLQEDVQYQSSQSQLSQSASQPLQSHDSQAPMQTFSPYQQQWPQQYPPQLQQQPTPQAQISSQTVPPYPPYPPNQSINPSPEALQGSMPMQVPLSAQLGVGRPEAVMYGYGVTNRATAHQQPPQHNMQRPQQSQPHQNAFGSSLGESTYPVPGSHSTQGPRQGYMVYDGEGGRAAHSMLSHFLPGGYPPPHVSTQNPPPVRRPSPSQLIMSNQYAELVEKAVSMGYGRDFVASVIHSMEERGQPMDFNILLDRLNMHSSGGSQRAWSG